MKLKNTKWIKVDDLKKWIDDNRYLIHECKADVIDTQDILKELKKKMQTKISKHQNSELQQLRLNREILYNDILQQIKYLNDKKISLVKAYKYAVDKIDREIETLVSVGVKNGK